MYRLSSTAASGVFLGALVAVLAACSAPTGALGEGPVVLTAANFDTETARGDWFIKFFAPWCGHCKNMAPTWMELAGKINDEFRHIADVDCTVERDLCERFAVRGFPTLKVVSGGKVYDYSGGRDASSLEGFLVGADGAEGGFKAGEGTPLPAKKGAAAGKAQDGPSDVVVLTADNFEKVVVQDTSGKPWLLKLYAPWCGHCKRMAPAYEEVATMLKGEVNVGEADCDKHSALARRFGVRGFPTIVLVKDGQVYKHKGARGAEDLAAFARTGYETSEDVRALGDAPGLVSQQDFAEVWALVNRVVAKNIWISMGTAFAVGLLFGAVLFGGSSQPPQRRAAAAKPKAGAAAKPKAAGKSPAPTPDASKKDN